jgi:amino acid permease
MDKRPLVAARERLATDSSDLGVKYDSPSRTATISSAIFNLVSTIVGGGVLSLPFAISVQGVFGGIIALILSAMASDFSIYILIASSRSRGARGYEDVAAAAMGESARVVTVFLIFAITFLISIAYTILCADLLTALVDLASNNQIIAAVSREYVIIGFIIAVSPLTFFRKMDALRFTSILSVCAVFVLGLVTAYKLIVFGMLKSEPWKNETAAAPAPSRATFFLPLSTANNTTFPIEYSRSYNHTLPLGEILWWPKSYEDYIYAIPIEAVAFLCHFNVLPMQDELIRPTRARVQKVTHTTLYICSFLYALIALTGYFRFTSSTCGDYLNNFLNADPIATIGRIGLFLTLYCSFPLVILPCRSSFNRLIGLLFKSKRNGNDNGNSNGKSNDANESQEENEELGVNQSFENQGSFANDVLSPMGSFIADSPHWMGAPTTGNDNINSGVGDTRRSIYGTVRTSTSVTTSPNEKMNLVNDDSRTTSKCRHIVVTLLLIVINLILSLKIESVVTIWSIAGSSVAMLISYVGPCMFYIRLRRGVPCNPRIIAAWFLMFASIILMVLCTWQAVMQLDRPLCPSKSN